MSTTFTPVVGSGFASSPVSFDRKNDTVSANVHSPTPSTPVTGMSSHIPQVDSAILGTETLEQREKFTVKSIICFGFVLISLPGFRYCLTFHAFTVLALA